ncbi:hypothetical protein N657DRAFT_233474 [Parathielavia appendiculata]|uniref:Uncharacterized protein n=1 Tax=Parathielavia appendiculata TaxID=2587402 RepID=A0AAN6U828_9PEZI|nr:hypothetical protein N657DRAFT_233474 [Parathielavia appendiculata]
MLSIYFVQEARDRLSWPKRELRGNTSPDGASSHCPTTDLPEYTNERQRTGQNGLGAAWRVQTAGVDHAVGHDAFCTPHARPPWTIDKTGSSESASGMTRTWNGCVVLMTVQSGAWSNRARINRWRYIEVQVQSRYSPVFRRGTQHTVVSIITGR